MVRTSAFPDSVFEFISLGAGRIDRRIIFENPYSFIRGYGQQQLPDMINGLAST